MLAEAKPTQESHRPMELGRVLEVAQALLSKENSLEAALLVVVLTQLN